MDGSEGDSSRYRLFSESWFWALVAHAVLSQMATLLLRVTTSYRALEIELDPAWLAIFSVAYSLFPLIFGITAGRATDRYGERPTLILGGAAVMAAALAFVFVGGSVYGLLACNMLLGLGHVLGMLGEQSIAAKRGPSVQRDRIFGYYTVFVALGQVLSPMFIAVVGGQAIIPDTQAIFVGTAVVAGLSLVVCLMMTSSDREPVDGPVQKPGSVLSLFRIPGMTAAMSASIILLASMDLLMVYLPALGTERHIEAATISMLLSLRAVASMVSRISFHVLIARLGRPVVMVGSLMLAAISFAVLPLELPLWALCIVIVVAGYVLGLSLPLTLAWMSELSPFAVRGTVVSLRLSGNRLGQIIIPAFAGFVAFWVGIAGVFWSTGAMLGVIAFTTSRAFRKPTNRDAAL